MQVSICLGAILILEYILEYPKRMRPKRACLSDRAYLQSMLLIVN